MTRRLPQQHRIALGIAVVVGSMLGFADASHACSRTVPRFAADASAIVSNADAAFVGTIVEIRPLPPPAPPVAGPGPSVLTFTVEERVKGALHDRVEIVSFGSGMCGIDGTVGNRMGLLLTRKQGAYGPWSAEEVPITLFRKAAAWAERTGRPFVMQLGRGLGPYRIGMRRTIFSGLMREIRHQENDAGGCSGGFLQDSFVDVYPRLRLGYVFTVGGGTYLDTIATTRPGDRTSLGFVVGKSTLAQLRSKHSGLRLSRHLGGSTLSLYHQTGYEAGAHLTYGFNATGTLVRLETGVGGC
jgi:hypothetical protein